MDGSSKSPHLESNTVEANDDKMKRKVEEILRKRAEEQKIRDLVAETVESAQQGYEIEMQEALKRNERLKPSQIRYLLENTIPDHTIKRLDESVRSQSQNKVGFTLHDVVKHRKAYDMASYCEQDNIARFGEKAKKAFQDYSEKRAEEKIEKFYAKLARQEYDRDFDKVITDSVGGFGYEDALSTISKAAKQEVRLAGAGLLGGAVVGTALANVANRNAQLNQERLAAGESADEIVNGILNYTDTEEALKKELMDQKAAEEAKMRQIYGDTLDGFSELADLAYEAQNELKELQNNKNASVKEVREQREYANALLNELAAREAIIAERLTHNGLDTGLNTQKQKAEFLKDFMKVNQAEIQKRMGYFGRGRDLMTDSGIGLRNAYNATASKFADAVDYSVLNRLGNSIVNSSLYNSLANGLSNASDSARTRWNSLKDWYANRRLVNADLNVG